MPPLFLGLDSSTQALKASLLSAELDVLAELEVRFDNDLAHFNTRGGVLYGPANSGEVFSPVMQPVEALDLLCERIKAAGWNVNDIRGVSAAGQQHASVYWSHQAEAILSTLDPKKSLTEQLEPAFSRSVIPNWQDSSTGAECEALTTGVGGPEALARLTGSSAHTRFTASQIARFRRIDPKGYEKTARIGLVSSFVTTLLCLDGEVKGIDESDACGMNLWDMSQPQRGWSHRLLEIIAGSEPGAAEELERKLGKIETDGGRVVGHIGQWFVERYGFSSECVVLPGTGDNPATFLSLVLRESEGLISMGTSDVVLVSTAAYNPHPEYHAFFHPAQIAPPSIQDGPRERHESFRYFNMLVYKNGSLAREHVRDRYFAKSWDNFNLGVETLRSKTADDLPTRTAFWWLLPDIIPAGASGVFKYVTSRDNDPADSVNTTRVEEFDTSDAEALAILESQLLNYSSRSSAILQRDDAEIDAPVPRLSRIYATGGASANRTILSLMADVLGCPVSKSVEFDPKTRAWSDANWNACSVGVAYKARWGWERHVAGAAGDVARAALGFDDFIAECRQAKAANRSLDETSPQDEEGVRNVAVPGVASAAYGKVVNWWQALEARALREM